MGAIASGFASQQGVYRTRAAAMLWTASAMALSTFVGALAGHSLVALVIVTMLWGYAYGIIASLGPAATTVGINSVIALIIFGHLPSNVALAALNGVLVFAGGLVQTFLLVSVWPLRRFSAERHALAAAARNLAVYALDIAEGKEVLPSSQPLANVQQTLADPQPFARRGDVAAFQSVLNELRRIRGSLAALATDRALGGDTQAIDELIRATAAILTEAADALDAAREPVDSGDMWWPRITSAEARLEAMSSAAAHVRSEAHALAGQLRSVWRLTTFPADTPVATGFEQRSFLSFRLPAIEDTIETLRANLTQNSPFGRLAPRVAATLALATILGGILPTQHGYWIGMTSVILLRPDFSQTFLRSVSRIGGTLLGAVFATLISAHVRPGVETYVALCIIFATLGYYVFKANYALFTVAITSYVAFALALLGQPESMALRDRVLGTVVAGILALIAIFVWPTWEATRVRTALADLIEAQRKYLRTVLGAYIDPAKYSASEIAETQRMSWSQRANAEASVDRMLGDPHPTHAISPQSALGVLAASRRIGLGTLSLNAHYDHTEHAARPGLKPFADALDRGLEYAENALRDAAPHGEPPHLREAYRATQEQLSTDTDPNATMILAVGDSLVDATNTLVELCSVQDDASAS
ncbi:MAG TPA: FUSC family protein [Candidatus Acidoferrales bacterium]|nr:FUSC family protein [Candidatus Acidoferrales bacterium]